MVPAASAVASGIGRPSVASPRALALSWTEVARAVAWVLYLAGAAALLAQPLNQGLLYDPIEPLLLIPSHVLTGTLFTAWFALGLALVAWRRDGQPAFSASDGLMLVVVLNLVYTGKWVLNAAPIPAAEGFYYGGDIHFLAQFGELSSQTVSLVGGYTAFPGIMLLGAETHILSGITVQQTIVLLQFVHGAILAAVIFGLMLQVVRSPSYAAVGTAILLLGNVGIGRWGDSFHPTIWGFIFLAMLLLMLARTVFVSDGFAEAALLMLLVFGMVVEHFITSITAAGLVTAAFVASPRLRSAASWELVAIAGTAIFAWQLYVANLYFAQIVSAVRDTALQDTFYWLGLATATHVTGIPRWAQGVWLFWGLVTFVIPGLVGLWRMARIIWLPRWERVEVLALAAVVLSVAAMTSGGAAGSQYHRLLLYMPFVSTPIMVRVLRDRLTKPMLAAVGVGIFVVLAYPSFLVQHYAVSNEVWQQYELAPLEHLAAERVLDERPVNEALGPWVFGAGGGSTAAQHYSGGDRRRLRTESELLGQHAPELVSSLADYSKIFESGESSPSYFLYVPSRVSMTYRQRFGEDAWEATNWRGAFERLERTSRVYDNGEAVLYYR